MRSLFYGRAAASTPPSTSPSPLRSPPAAVGQFVDSLLFSGDAWLPAELGVFSFAMFGAAKWTRTPVALWMDRVVDDAVPMLHVRLGERVAVVAGVHHQSHNGDEPADDRNDSKKPISLDVKLVNDVRRAILYHTAAASSTLTFHVDTPDQRGLLLAIIHNALSPPSPLLQARPQVSVSSSPTKLQHQPVPRRDVHIVDAKATPRRIHTSIPHSLAQLDSALPMAPSSVASTATESAPSSSSSFTMDERLQQLQAYSQSREVDRAQRERRVCPDDLKLRLNALKNEPTAVPSMATLQQRLEKLCGEGSGHTTDLTAASSSMAKLSPVDQIVQQAMDEVALGIVDNCDDSSHSEDASDASSSAFTSSSDDDSDDETRSRRPHPQPSRWRSQK